MNVDERVARVSRVAENALQGLLALVPDVSISVTGKRGAHDEEVALYVEIDLATIWPKKPMPEGSTGRGSIVLPFVATFAYQAAEIDGLEDLGLRLVLAGEFCAWLRRLAVDLTAAVEALGETEAVAFLDGLRDRPAGTFEEVLRRARAIPQRAAP